MVRNIKLTIEYDGRDFNGWQIQKNDYRTIQGEIKNFTGISDPYEEPENPELVVDTDKETPQESAQKILDTLIELDFIKPLDPKIM